MTIQPASEYAEGAFLIDSTLLFSCFFVHFGTFVFEICGRVGNEMPSKRKHFGQEKVGPMGQKKKRWRRASPVNTLRKKVKHLKVFVLK